MTDPSSLLPTVRDQGERETCLTMALTDGHHAARGEPPALSVEYLHCKAAAVAGVGVNDAVPASAGRKALEVDGQPPEEECPYSTVLRPDGWKPPEPFGVVWRRATSQPATPVWSTVESELSARVPVVLVLEIDDAFWAPNEGLVVEPLGPPRASHAVLGLELDSSTSTVRVRNSWGTAWGEDGHCRLSRTYLEARCTSVITFPGQVA